MRWEAPEDIYREPQRVADSVEPLLATAASTETWQVSSKYQSTLCILWPAKKLSLNYDFCLLLCFSYLVFIRASPQCIGVPLEGCLDAFAIQNLSAGNSLAVRRLVTFHQMLS